MAGGGRRLTPQACRLPRPQHAANESNGNGWAHMVVVVVVGGASEITAAGREELERK